MARRIPQYRPPHAPQSEKERQRRFKRDRTDKETNAFYSSRAWTNCRRNFLIANPLCWMCQEEGITTAATVADHQIEIKDDMSKAFDWDNLKPLCKRHHNSKTATTSNRRRYAG